MSAISSDQIGRLLGGRYRLTALVGVGASARVYKAEDTQLHRQVAVKVLHDALSADPVVRRRFAAEATAAAALNHPHLLAVYDVGDDGGPYIVTEYLSGGSLRSLLDAGHRLTLSQALLVSLEAVRGLEHAHGAGLVHRDIKPANLLFGADRRLRIGDFGLAKVLADAALTEPSGSMLGTARYASPEQARGDAVSPATDIYSLALVIIESVTGVVPFTSEHPMGGLVQRTERPIEVPAALGVLRGPLERAGRIDPAERPDAGELAVALLAAAGDLPRPTPLPLVFDRVDADDAPVDPTSISPTTPEVLEVASADDPVVESFVDTPTTLLPEFAPEADDTGVVDRPVEASAPPAVYDQALEGDEAREPRRGLAIAVAAFIVLLIGALGAYAWWQQRTPTHPVPELVGQSRDELDALVGDFDWEVEVTETRAEGTEPGEIVSQDPVAGTELAEGDPLAVVVSLGPPLVEVPPDLVGQSLEDATAGLSEAGLQVGEVTRTFDEEAPADQVLSVGVAEVEQLPQGSSVDLTVSDGPAPRVLPELVGLSRDDASAQLAELGLEVEIDEDASREVAEGIVVSSDPATGTTIERGATVTLVVSSGLPWINLPDVVGLDVDEATQVLEDANLVIAGVEGPPNRRVVATDPEAGVPIQEGQDVTLITRSDDDESRD